MLAHHLHEQACSPPCKRRETLLSIFQYNMFHGLLQQVQSRSRELQYSICLVHQALLQASSSASVEELQSTEGRKGCAYSENNTLQYIFHVLLKLRSVCIFFPPERAQRNSASQMSSRHGARRLWGRAFYAPQTLGQ